MHRLRPAASAGKLGGGGSCCSLAKYEDLVDRSTLGTTVFWIVEEEGERMMQLDWRIQGDDSDYIFLDGRLKLHRDGAL